MIDMVVDTETRAAEAARELSALYEKAKTEDEYKEIVRRGEEIKNTLEGEFPDIEISVLYPSYFAEYYSLLKFPSSRKDRYRFADRMGWLCATAKDPDNRVKMFYLRAEIASNLLGDQENANWCNNEINKIISSEKVSIASILRHINSRGTVEMAENNWREAVKIFSEIERFPEDILKRPENLRHTANITNNWGASLIRGDIDLPKGREKLLIARELYLQEEVPPEKHLEGIKNRLREADEKS